MGIDKHTKNRRMAGAVEGQAGVGITEIVSGWQAMLVDLLNRMKPFLRPGVTVTFQHLTPSERSFFERLNNEVRITQCAVAIYLPPSVRKQMLGGTPVIDETSASSIVLFSTVAVGTGMPFHASIASAKGAIEGLTRSLAAEFAPRIRVNAIAPSQTDTNMARVLLSDDGKRAAAAERHPLKRVGRPTDIAAAAKFLLDDSASWITGQIIAVDGGMGAIRTFK